MSLLTYKKEKKKKVLFLEQNYLLIPEKVIKKKKGLLSKRNEEPDPKGNTFRLQSLKCPEEKKTPVPKNRCLTCGNAAPQKISSF